MAAVELEVGDEAFVLVWHEIGRRGTRQQLDGVARVRVVELVAGGARVRVEVVQAGRGSLPGQVLERDRGAVYATRSRSERATFADLVRRYWGGA